MVGVIVRRMLLEVVVKQWEVSVDELIILEGVIKYEVFGQFIGYGEIVLVVVSIEVFEEVLLKDLKDFKIIGIDCKNVDGFKIVKGEFLFGIDVQEEGMLIVMIEYFLVFGMKLKFLDVSVVKGMFGIKDVIIINIIVED